MPSLSRQLQNWLCMALRLTGIPWLLRETYARHKVTIINYHDPSPDVFKRHMKFFSRAYSFISIDQLADALTAQDFSSLPDKPLLVTLDDGLIGNACLFETMRSHAIPVVIYAVAGIIDTKRGFWFNLLDHGSEVMQQLKTLPDEERRERLIRDYGHSDEREYEMASALSARNLRTLLAIGGTVGSHSLFHPMLDQCNEIVGLNECLASRVKLEEMIGSPVDHFALPNGNVGPSTLRWVAEAGYRTCRTTVENWVTPETDPLSLPNFGISDDASLSKAIVQATGIWAFAKSRISERNS